jgi:hypothetical protein
MEIFANLALVGTVSRDEVSEDKNTADAPELGPEVKSENAYVRVIAVPVVANAAV